MTPNDNRFLRIRGIQEVVPFGRSKIYDLISRGEFPAPIKIDGCAVWPASVVQQWIADRIAKSEVDAA